MQQQGPRSTIESHGSYLTNQRMTLLFAEIDRLALQSANSLSFPTINAYYNAVEQVYLNVTTILGNTDEIEKTREKYNRVMNLINSHPKAQTRNAVDLMLKITKQFNHQVVKGLQALDYFFRVGSRQQKGLKNIKFFDESIFGGKSDNGNGNEDGEEELDQ